MKFNIAILASFMALCACTNKGPESTGNKPKPDDQQEADVTLLDFYETDEDFANPERGFYFPVGFHHAGSPVSVSKIEGERKSKRTLVLLEFFIRDYMERDIDQEYLNMVDQSFQNVRAAGAKAIVRFAYSNNNDDASKPWDTSEEWIMRHIAQLKPILMKNGDVLYVFQAGFIGSWGEWAYTDNFVIGADKETAYAARRRVVEAILDAIPESRQIEVRTPEYKMRMYGLRKADTLTVNTAHDGSILSRIAGHNDCFVASSSDYGTFRDSYDRLFWKRETRYTIMGGETCAVSDYCKCENSIADLQRQHWSYLNIDYNTNVLNVWKKEGCFDDVCRRLGYRLSITEGSISKELRAGRDATLKLSILNSGFSAPQNPREACLVLIDRSGKETEIKIDTDPRFWFENQTTELEINFELPRDPGTYQLCLNLPDPEPSLRNNPLYSIRLANEETWMEDKGYNKIADIEVE